MDTFLKTVKRGNNFRSLSMTLVRFYFQVSIMKRMKDNHFFNHRFFHICNTNNRTEISHCFLLHEVHENNSRHRSEIMINRLGNLYVRKSALEIHGSMSAIMTPTPYTINSILRIFILIPFRFVSNSSCFCNLLTIRF